MKCPHCDARVEPGTECKAVNGVVRCMHIKDGVARIPASRSATPTVSVVERRGGVSGERGQ